MTVFWMGWLVSSAVLFQTDGSWFTRQAVVSVCPIGSRVGANVLRAGGNAVDAAVATAFALAVTHPAAGNIGGGGFMLVAGGPDREPEVIDYREVAPAAATARMFQAGESGRTHRAVGVPGTVAGLALAHRRHGTVSWPSLVQPAIILARDGFAIDAALAQSLNGQLKESSNESEFRRVYGKPGGGIWKSGDRLILSDLAGSLESIAKHGEDGFYRGRVAEALVSEMKRGGGILTHDDLKRYRAIVRDAVRINFRGHEILALPPPSSGGVCLFLMLGMFEETGLGKHPRDSAVALHLMAESMRRAFRERARHLGDPAFAANPTYLVDPLFAQQLGRTIDQTKATASAALAGDIEMVNEKEHTTHFSVIDKWGRAVSNTYTLEDSYGSRIVVGNAGFLLNNEMQDFNWFPGRTDTLGRIGTPANQVAPGKRMLSSQCPVIVRKNRAVVGITGSPGGRTIPSTVAQIVANKLVWNMPIDQAVSFPRLHHGWFPDELRFEKADDPAWANVVADLRRRGHKVVHQVQGDAHSLWREGDLWHAGIDNRIAGGASGD
jgi:gamma-glutamyltranspeptidase/glutathione hydrolase